MYLIYADREKIFRKSATSAFPGSLLILAGMVFYVLGKTFGIDLQPNDFLSVMTFAAVLSWIGGFILFYGLESFRLALFPFLV